MECLELIKSYSIKAGLSIKPNTKVSELIPYLPYIDMILIMSVEPGAGGQAFIEESEERVNEVRALLDSYNIPAIINIDGGINGETVNRCRKCDMVVAGSYIVKSDNFQEKISSLR
jgi:ribulose-phosphate 3-epimerase